LPMKKSLSTPNNGQPFSLRFLATFFSYLFHPVFIASYVMVFLLFVHPYVYTGFDLRTRSFRLFSVVFSTALLPLFSVFLLWKLRLFTQSMQLRSAKERIIPYVLVMIFYFWMWHVFNNLSDPPIVVHFFLGSFLAICFSWFCNIYFKISMHAVAVGGLVGFMILFSFIDSYASGMYVGTALLIAGIVCTSRFIISDHSPFEIYTGLFMGILAQFIAWQL
jgi:hypothetical protein